MVASVEKFGDVLDSLSTIFNERMSMKNPDNKDRELILEWLLKNADKQISVRDEKKRKDLVNLT